MKRFVLCLLLASLPLSCAPSFKKFKSLDSDSPGLFQHRVNPSGNAVVPASDITIENKLYERKLNGGASAQIIGSTQFIIVPTYNKRLYFFDPKSGKEITSIVGESSIGSAPAIVGELLYFAEESGSDLLTCFNMINGKKVWSVELRDPPGSPIIDGDELFIASRDGRVLSINRWTGVIDWEIALNSRVYGAVSVDTAHVYVGTDRGDVIALNRKDGIRLWEFHTGGAIFAQALISDYLYCGSADGQMYALNPSDGKLAWVFETLGEIHTTPVKLQNHLVFGSGDKVVYCLNANDGGILWRYETAGIIHSAPIAVGEKFVVANSAGEILLFDLEGKLLQSTTVRGSIEAPPAFIDGKLFVVTAQRRLYAFGSATH